MDTKNAHSHVPVGQAGDAFYSNSVETAYDYHAKTWEYVERALKEIESVKDTEQPFVVANFGSSDGGVSLELMGRIVRKIRQKFGTEKPIVVQYEDQADNDFVGLFKMLTGAFRDSKSFFCTEENIFVNACGVSFFNQCYPSRSIDLSLSSTAFHWLKDKPSHDIYSFGKFGDWFTGNAEQSKREWESLLLFRATEMKTGARMVLCETSKTTDGSQSGKTANIRHICFNVLHDCWTHLFRIRRISKREFEEPILAVHIRSQAEHKLPFLDPNGVVMQAGLRLVSMETRLTRCAFHVDLLQHPSTGHREHARKLVNAVRSFTNFSFFSALSEERNVEERNTILEELYQRYEDIVEENPLDHGLDYIHNFIVIKKVEPSVGVH